MFGLHGKISNLDLALLTSLTGARSKRQGLGTRFSVKTSLSGNKVLVMPSKLGILTQLKLVAYQVYVNCQLQYGLMSLYFFLC